MNTYKFRGKRFDNSEWVYGDLLQEHRHSKNPEYESESFYISDHTFQDGDFVGEMFRVIPLTVGQFTGRTDKLSTPKEIYAGDIIECEKKKYLVYWDENECAFKLDFKYFHHKDGDECHTILSMRSRPGIIIGNITDNPELLGKTNKEEKP